MVTLMASGGLAKFLTKSMDFLSILFKASSAAYKAGIAFSNSPFTSSSIALAASTSTYTVASSLEITSAIASAFSFSTATTLACSAASSADF